MATIPTLDNPEKVELKNGGYLLVRRARKSALNDIAAAAGLKSEQDLAGALRYQELQFRWGVVGGEGVVDAEMGGKVKVRREKHPTLRRICVREVYDAVTNEDVSAVCEVIAPDPEEQEAESGNSSDSPDGSTGDD